MGAIFGRTLAQQLDFVPENNIVEDVSVHYETIQVLGSGTTSRVLEVKWLETGEMVALKQMNQKDLKNQKLFRRECRILQKLDHPDIIRYIDCYVDQKYFYIITHLCMGGHLLDHLKEMSHFTEEFAADVMKQIVGGVAHMHEKNIAHRDLKPENIVFSETDFSQVVIIDLGSASELEAGARYKEWVGTPAFMAPEVFRPRTNTQVKASDIWSLGVILYQLLTGTYPFFGRNLEQIFSQISKKPLTFPPMALSAPAKALITSMLNRDITNRPTIQQVAQDPWFDSHGPEFLRPLSPFSEESNELESKSKEMELEFRKQVSTGLISTSLQQIIESLEDEKTSVTESLSLPMIRPKSCASFVSGLSSAGIHVDLEDVNEEEAIDHLFLCEPYLQKRRSQWPEELGEDELLRQAFEALDDNGNGQVLLVDLKLAMEDFLHRRIAFEEAEVFLDEIHPGENGSIQFEDFAHGMKALAEKSVIEITSLSIGPH